MLLCWGSSWWEEEVRGRSRGPGDSCLPSCWRQPETKWFFFKCLPKGYHTADKRVNYWARTPGRIHSQKPQAQLEKETDNQLQPQINADNHSLNPKSMQKITFVYFSLRQRTVPRAMPLSVLEQAQCGLQVALTTQKETQLYISLDPGWWVCCCNAGFLCASGSRLW